MIETSDEWIVARSGISERRIATDNEQTSDMACTAAHQALDMAGLKPSEAGHDHRRHRLPRIWFFLQLPAFCSANWEPRSLCPLLISMRSAAAFYMEWQLRTVFIRGGSAKNILVVGAEILSRIVNWQDRTTCVLFGDGAPEQ